MVGGMWTSPVPAACALLLALTSPPASTVAVSASVLPAAAALPAPTSGFSWPLAPPHPVYRRFEPPAGPYGPGHRGVDIGGSPGDPVLAAADGVVVFAGVLVDRGVVSIDHPDGLRTTYEPVEPSVSAGEAVSRGQVVGALQPGHAGCPVAACLHWGVRRGEQYLDPLVLLGPVHVRLLPWTG
jgi:murein DD-endopeptidase MepM/ murein hydrolase activator NlpD